MHIYLYTHIHGDDDDDADDDEDNEKGDEGDEDYHDDKHDGDDDDIVTVHANECVSSDLLYLKTPRVTSRAANPERSPFRPQ